MLSYPLHDFFLLLLHIPDISLSFIYYINIFLKFSYIATNRIFNRENLVLDLENNILNFKGEITPIVHQYNGHKDIKRESGS